MSPKLKSETSVDAIARPLRPGRGAKIALILSGIVLLSACSSDTTITPVATEPDIVSVKLAQAADRASNALDGIAAIEQQRSPASPKAEDYSQAPANLKQPVTIRWSGPVEQIVKAIADKSGLQYRVTGAFPIAPVTVTLDVYQQPLIEVLKNIGLQAGQRADVAVDAHGGVIEIRYAPIDKS
jgi:defect-in-organelle-trafficking protein DotD